jgi:hypothetical protein
MQFSFNSWRAKQHYDINEEKRMFKAWHLSKKVPVQTKANASVSLAESDIYVRVRKQGHPSKR